MTGDGTALAYGLSGILFLLALSGLCRPGYARVGHYFGVAGMVLAIGTALCTHNAAALPEILIALAVGGGVGLLAARRIAIAALPRLAAAFQSLVGLAAVLVGVAAFLDPQAFGMVDAGTAALLLSSRIELGLGVAFGAISYSGSLMALLTMKDRPVAMSLLTSCSGWAAAALGFALQNSAMVVAGALVGSSGAMLSLRFVTAAKSAPGRLSRK